jgi:lipid A 3-O-deacylase
MRRLVTRAAALLAASVFSTAFTQSLWAQSESASYGMADCNTGIEDISIPLPGWQFTWENDSIISPRPSDDYYTQGMQFGYRIRPDAQADWLSKPMAAICRWVASGKHPMLVGAGSVFLGQQFFTPFDLSDPDPIPDDRPYAGWLYLGARLELAQPFKSADDAEGKVGLHGLHHTFEMQVGVLGPPAQGEWVQREWHEVLDTFGIDAVVPRGWDNQIPTQVGLQARYKGRALLYANTLGATNWQVDATGNGELDLGTVMVAGGVGGTIRFGRNLGDPVTDQIRPSIALKSDDPTDRTKSFSDRVQKNLKAQREEGHGCLAWLAIDECYVFVGAIGRVVAFNAFLDGPIGYDRSTVDKERATYDYTWGARLRWSRLVFDYTAVERSREFSPVPALTADPDGKHGFGSLNLRCVAPISPQDGRIDLVCPSVFGILVGLLALH